MVLLNQRVLAGLGNVYKSEVAFAAGVNPFRAMRTITPREMEVMVDVAQRYMKANVVDGEGDGIVTYSGNRTDDSCDGPRGAAVGVPAARAGVPAVRCCGDDAEAGSAGAVDLLVSRVPAMGGDGGDDGARVVGRIRFGDGDRR